MENQVDNQGTTQSQARQMLINLCERGFHGNIPELAVALGRPLEELNNMIDSEETIDDDLAMKIRGIAQQRNLEIE